MSTLTLTHPAPAHLASSFFEKPSSHFCAPRSPILPLLSLLDLIHTTTYELSPPPSPSNMSKVPEMQEVSSLFAARAVETELPPPPYAPAPLPRTQNPGFCEHAFSERKANTIPGGGRTGAQYFEPCTCGFVVSDSIPASYKEGWPGWIDPSVNYRWESHLPPSNPNFASNKKLDLEGGGGERLGCWICYEYDGVWKGGMGVEEWYAHFRGHVRAEGYRVCRGKTGGMQRRRNCGVEGCSKVHS